MNLAGLPSITFAERSQLPRVAAVYFVFDGNRLLYVGRSGNLRRRWLNDSHDKYVLFCEKPSITIAWFETTDITVLERRLILVLRPPLNRLMPRGCVPTETSYPIRHPEPKPRSEKRYGVDWLLCICKRCDHKWISRKGIPQVCPNPRCHSPIWNKPKPAAK